MILTEVWKTKEGVFLNTEEMLAGINEVNDSHVMEESENPATERADLTQLYSCQQLQALS